MATSLCTHVTARDPSPTANPTRLVAAGRAAPRRKTARARGLQRARLAFRRRPAPRARRVRAGQDIAELVARDRFRQPRAPGVGADEHEPRRDREPFRTILLAAALG